MTGRGEKNRLAREASAYLRGAADQPVDWYPWGEEAFRKAKAEDKPLLLDVGAVWCHWCHVLDHESYEDADLASFINDHFVPVKVDRDERPDVDARYQRAVSALTGQGGWPLTAFLTPEGKVFYGGTYFPPTEMHGRPSFRRVLEAVLDYYRKDKAKVLEDAENLRRIITQRHGHGEEAEPGEFLVDQVLDEIGANFDAVNGGFGRAPKFPHPGALELVMAAYWRTGDDFHKAVIEGTLTAMARGGFHDQVAGGFHRYATDAKWIVPHFEKMAYDNAWLLVNYVHGYRILGRSYYRDVAEGIVRWVDTTLSDRERGGFYASQDADVGPGDDGDHYTWTLDELNAALPDEESRVLALYFGVGAHGEMHHDPGRNVLHIAKEPEEIAKILKTDVAAVREAIQRGIEGLRAARLARPQPFVDPTIYANWNGMFVSAYLEAYKAMGWEDCRAFALKTLDRLLRELWSDEDGVYHQLADGGPRVSGLLDDHVEMARAALAAYETTGEASYLAWTRRLVDVLLDRFWDDEGGGFFDRAREAQPETEGMDIPHKPLQDAPSPSPNAVAALLLDKLERVTGEETYRRREERMLRGLAGEMKAHGGVFGGTFFLAMDAFLRRPAVAVVVGSREAKETRALHRAALETFHPGKVVVLADREGAEDAVPAPVRPMLAAKEAKKGSVAFVCRGTTCSPPTSSPEKVRALLASPS